MFRYSLIVSVSCVALGQLVAPAHATIPALVSEDFGNKIKTSFKKTFNPDTKAPDKKTSGAKQAEVKIEDAQPVEIELDDLVVIKDRSSLVKRAALAASAAYNDTDLVSLHGRSPLRSQKGFDDRATMLEEGQDVVSFSANISGQGHVPAGIVSYKNGVVTVSYHGSECVEDFTEANLGIFKTKNDDLGLGGRVHNGFNSRFMQSREAMRDVVQDMLERHGKNASEVKFVVTGHSLGAALATLGAADIKKNIASESQIDLVTFSSPRVLDHEAAANLEGSLGKNHMLRVWRDKDPVPAVVLGIFGYKHAGTSVKLKAGTSYMGLSNHDLGSIKADAFKVEDVEVQEHEGYRRQWSRLAGKVVSAPVNGVKALGRGISSAGRKFGSWFGY